MTTTKENKTKRDTRANKPDITYYNTDFIPKLTIGHHYEEMAITQLLKYYGNEYTVSHRNNDSRYDFELSNGDKFEVKADLSSVKTSNIFVEFYQYGKPSGVALSEADYFIFVAPYPTKIQYLLIEKIELEFLIASKQYKYIFKNKLVKGYIFDIEKIEESSVIIVENI